MQRCCFCAIFWKWCTCWNHKKGKQSHWNHLTSEQQMLCKGCHSQFRSLFDLVVWMCFQVTVAKQFLFCKKQKKYWSPAGFHKRTERGLEIDTLVSRVKVYKMSWLWESCCRNFLTWLIVDQSLPKQMFLYSANCCVTIGWPNRTCHIAAFTLYRGSASGNCPMCPALLTFWKCFVKKYLNEVTLDKYFSSGFISTEHLLNGFQRSAILSKLPTWVSRQSLWKQKRVQKSNRGRERKKYEQRKLNPNDDCFLWI